MTCRCREETRSLDRSRYRNSSKSRHRNSSKSRHRNPSPNKCTCSSKAIRSRSRGERDPCPEGSNFYANVLGPTADETILRGLQIFIGLRNNQESVRGEDPDVLKVEPSMKSRASSRHRNDENKSRSIKSRASSRQREEESISRQEYILANLKFDDNADSSSQTDDMRVINQNGSQTSQHQLHNGSQTHYSTNDSSTDSPCIELPSECIEHDCLLPNIRCNCPNKYQKQKCRKVKRVPSKCVCGTRSEYKTNCVRQTCSLRKFKKTGARKTPCLCKSESTFNGSESNKMQKGDANDTDIKYAITKITKFCSYTTFEVMKCTRKKPRIMPNSIMGVFVLKNFQN